MYRQVLDPVGGSLFLSSIFAALPLLTLFLLLGVVRMKAWLASLISLAVALGVGIAVYGMPVGQAGLAATLGAAFGFFPILWIVLNAIWVYNMTVETGHFDVLRRSFARISDDQRIQAVIIAFSFGALLEALAGFGTPVAITSVMLIALGFRPLKAAVLALVANTAPVAFGALAVPITTLAKVTSMPVQDLGSMVGRQTPILAVFVPLVLVFIVDGRRAIRQTWPAALVCGVVFAIAQWLTSNYVSVPLTDIVASLASAAAVVLFLRVWRPAMAYSEAGNGPLPAVAGGAADAPTPEFAGRVAHPDAGVEVARAYAPYLIIIAVFVLAQVKPIAKALDSVTATFAWPGLHLQNPAGSPLTALATFRLNWLSAAGTLMIIAGLLTIPAIGVSARKAVHAYARTWVQLRWAILTVMAVLALAFVMNASGQTATLGNWMAGAGAAFALISPILGWLGVAVTGSDTSSNSLFGALQVTAAGKAGLDPLLMAASNSSGGVLGKMVSPQNLAIAAAAVGLAGKEGEIFRKVIFWSLLMLVGMGLLSYLQSTPVLSWMIP